MTGKQLLDNCASIIKRQDLNRTLLLFYLNDVVKATLRSTNIPPRQKTLAITLDSDGTFNTYTNNIKTVQLVEYVDTDGKRAVLGKLPSYEVAISLYSMSAVGVPASYVELGEDIKILPVPSDGTIEVTAEYYNTEITDTSTAIDNNLASISAALVYLATAEYFDMLDELQKGNFWRQKGQDQLAKYDQHLKRKQAVDINIMSRDPFGNLGTPTVETAKTYEINEDDQGVF